MSPSTSEPADDAGTAAPIPAGGAGADSGAVDAARIDETDRAEIANVSSQNDIPGVGTRAGDGSMETDTGGDDIPAADLPSEERQPETQGDDPVAAALGEDGQGDLAPEDL